MTVPARLADEVGDWDWHTHFGGGGFKPPSTKVGKEPIEKITPIHKKIMSLYFKGLSYEDISLITNHSITAIGQILNNPTIKKEVDRLFEYADHEFEGMYISAIKAIRQGMNSNDGKTQLLAVDRFMKATGRYQKHDNKDDGPSAEEIVARIVTHMSDGNVTSIGNNRGHQRMIDITPRGVEQDNGSDKAEVLNSKRDDSDTE